jgi:hypothetical protein
MTLTRREPPGTVNQRPTRVKDGRPSYEIAAESTAGPGARPFIVKTPFLTLCEGLNPPSWRSASPLDDSGSSGERTPCYAGVVFLSHRRRYSRNRPKLTGFETQAQHPARITRS